MSTYRNKVRLQAHELMKLNFDQYSLEQLLTYMRSARNMSEQELEEESHIAADAILVATVRLLGRQSPAGEICEQIAKEWEGVAKWYS